MNYLHATVAPGARLALPWPRDFNALVYVLSGRGTAGVERAGLDEGQLAVFAGSHHGGEADGLVVQAAERQPVASANGWEILVLGGLPIREPIARYGPFVMNTRDEIVQAFEDFQAGRMGTVPAEQVPHRSAADESL
ncbi:pirin-like C-terminal cupin domain-containing protein [Actinomadura chibensis]|uniref:pirin-like C-terminal cupin domain-containing protein n=1 Tax=Actinomadura chibensis TaxID=392828 RepID=UPI00278C05CD|nr:pirin-like C-terminal cupin domain-containing protein [Actinomadura chibensis]